MALKHVGNLNCPNYIALSTDISDDMIAGATNVGQTIFLYDTGVWKIIESDLTLSDWALPITFNGSVDIGAVHLSQNFTDSIELSPVSATKRVTVSGTAESLTGTDIFAVSILVQPIAGNAGDIFFGDSGVDKTTSKQIIIGNTSPGVAFDVPVGYKLNLKDFYIDADNPNDGVKFMYIAEV